MTEELEKPKGKRGRKPKAKVEEVTPVEVVEATAPEKSDEDKSFDQPNHGHEDEKPADVVGEVKLVVDPATFLKISNGLQTPEPEVKAEVDVGTLSVEKAKKVIEEVKKSLSSDDHKRIAAEKEAARLAWYRGGRRR